MSNTDMNTMPIPDLIEALKKQAEKRFEKNDLVIGLTLNVIAGRMSEMQRRIDELEGLCNL